MGLEEVKKDILESAKKEAESITGKAKDEASKILSDENKRIVVMASEKQKEITTMKDSFKVKETASINLEAKRKLLDVKKQVVDEVFANVKVKLKKLGKTEKKDVFSKLMKKAGQEIEIGNVFCNKIDKALVDFKNVSEKECLGGIVVEDKSGKVSVDYTFESLLDEVYDNHMGEVSKLLFD